MTGQTDNVTVTVADAVTGATSTVMYAVPLLGASYACKQGDDVRTYLQGLPAGATASIQPGPYPVRQPITTLAAHLNLYAPQVVLDGSVTLTGWTASGGLWYIDGQLPSGTADVGNGGGIQPEYSASHTGKWNDARWNDNCLKREDLYLADDPANPVRLTRVMAQGFVASGSFFADYTANRIWVADNPAMHPVKMCLTSCAIQTSASPTITQMEFAYFATPAQRGALWLTGGTPIITDVKSRWNHSTNLYVAQCAHPIITRGDYRFAGQTGIAAYGNTGGGGNGGIYGLPNCSNFNQAGFRVLDGENGGAKVTASNGFDVTVQAWDGHGLGVWLDVTNHGVNVNGCDLQRNGADGIRDEIGYDAVIQNNTVIGNGLEQMSAYGANNGSPFLCAEIHVANSQNSQVRNNFVVATLNGIFADMRNRSVNGVATICSGSATGNTVTMKGTSPVLGVSGKGYYDTAAAGQMAGFTFDSNAYLLAAAGQARFHSAQSNLPWSGWQGAGNDPHGTVGVAP